jgi:integrase
MRQRSGENTAGLLNCRAADSGIHVSRGIPARCIDPCLHGLSDSGIGWHTFRHTFSTLIKSLGVDAKVVQELLRHASFKTTMDGYTQALEEPKRQAQAALADLIMRTGTAFHA